MTQQEARAEAREEYLRAQKAALKQLKDENLPPEPLVLDAILPAGGSDRYVDVGVVEIPAERTEHLRVFAQNLMDRKK